MTRAELEAVSDEVMQIVERLDGLNRYRLGGEAEMRAAWDNARNVLSGRLWLSRSRRLLRER